MSSTNNAVDLGLRLIIFTWISNDSDIDIMHDND